MFVAKGINVLKGLINLETKTILLTFNLPCI